jgi:hypothetical protein
MAAHDTRTVTTITSSLPKDAQQSPAMPTTRKNIAFAPSHRSSILILLSYSHPALDLGVRSSMRSRRKMAVITTLSDNGTNLLLVLYQGENQRRNVGP